MVLRCTFLATLAIALLFQPHPVRAQEQTPGLQGQPEDQFFSGTITALESDKITVTRTVLGTESTTKTFVITSETRFEGKPKLKARVTVRFVTEDEKDRAVHVVVRANGGKK